MHPLFDVENLTDAQLLDKIATTSARVMAVRVSGQNDAIVNQLKQVLMACQEEMSSRYSSKIDNEPVAWDMDSYLVQNQKDTSRDKEKESMPRWKAQALNELDDDGESPWG